LASLRADVVASPRLNVKYDENPDGNTSGAYPSHVGILPRVVQARKLKRKWDEEAQGKVANGDAKGKKVDRGSD